MVKTVCNTNRGNRGDGKEKKVIIQKFQVIDIKNKI